MSVPPLKKRSQDSSKRDFGRVLIIAGSYGMVGAACLAAEACYKSGAGVVYVFTPKKIYDVIATKLTTSVIIPAMDTEAGTLNAEAVDHALDFSSRCDVCALGPGIAQNDQVESFVRNFLTQVTIPTVVDADGLNNLDRKTIKKAGAELVLTPHEGELSRLASISADSIHKKRVEVAKKFVKESGCTLVLKGYRTVVANKNEVFVNETGNSGMATGGSGDVLTGVISALIGQKYKVFDAAKLGVHLHGLAGDFAAKELTEYSMTAEDIIEYLPKAFKKHSNA